MINNLSDFQRGAADECAAIYHQLLGTANMLHSPVTDQTPSAAYGLTRPIHLRAAANVLRHVAETVKLREELIRSGKGCV